MSYRTPLLAVTAAALFAVVGSASASAQEDCGYMHQRVMEAYQARSPHYAEMLNRYNARCLSGSSALPSRDGDHRRRYEDDRRGSNDDRHGYNDDRRGSNDDHDRRGR